MDLLKKFFPISFKCVNEVSNLIIGIIIYVVAGIIGGAIIALAGLVDLPLLGFTLSLIGGLLDVYITAGIVISILVYCKVIK